MPKADCSTGFGYTNPSPSPYEKFLTELFLKGAVYFGAGLGVYIVLKMLGKI